MTTKRILAERPDGSVSNIIPAPSYVQQLMEGGMTEDEAIEFIRYRDVPNDAVKVETVEADTLPDRTYRNAWRMS